MSYALTGTRYIGSGALPTPLAGYDVVDTSTGNIYVSNSSATAWNLYGNVNSPNLGMLPLTGGTMQGAILGATGWATADANNFVTTVKRASIDLVDTTQLAAQVTAINQGIGPKVTSAVAALAAGISVKGSIAIANGILIFTNNTPTSIPPPTYSDGTTAAIADCKWAIGLSNGSWPCGRSDSNGDTTLFNTFTATNNTGTFILKDNGGNYYSTTMWYLIIAIKS